MFGRLKEKLKSSLSIFSKQVEEVDDGIVTETVEEQEPVQEEEQVGQDAQTEEVEQLEVEEPTINTVQTRCTNRRSCWSTTRSVEVGKQMKCKKYLLKTETVSKLTIYQKLLKYNKIQWREQTEEEQVELGHTEEVQDTVEVVQTEKVEEPVIETIEQNENNPEVVQTEELIVNL